MKEFNYYVDEKMTIWGRTKFTIEADTQEEADELAKEVAKNVNDGIADGDYELLYDTEEYILPQENDNQPTIELFRNAQNEFSSIWNNVKEYEKQEKTN